MQKPRSPKHRGRAGCAVPVDGKLTNTKRMTSSGASASGNMVRVLSFPLSVIAAVLGFGALIVEFPDVKWWATTLQLIGGSWH
jgi:hypothetical protein